MRFVVNMSVPVTFDTTSAEYLRAYYESLRRGCSVEEVLTDAMSRCLGRLTHDFLSRLTDGSVSTVSLDALGLSTRTYNALRRAGVDSVDKLYALSTQDLYQVKSLGEKGITEVIRALQNYGISNLDYIRGLSVDELAASEFIPCPYNEDGYGECKFGWHDREQTCEECKREWLLQRRKETTSCL